MTKINYIKGDATKPQGEGKKIIIHICNDVGKWGRGFVVALSKRWKLPEQAYRSWYRARLSNSCPFELGMTQFVDVEDDIIVCNMIAQHNIKKSGEIPPIRYASLKECLEKVAIVAKSRSATVHGPRFGAGLAGGEWKKIEEIINETLLNEGIPVAIYDLS